MPNIRFKRTESDTSRRDVTELHGGGRFAYHLSEPALGDDAQCYADGGEADVEAPTSSDLPIPAEAPVQGGDVPDALMALRNFFLPQSGQQLAPPQAMPSHDPGAAVQAPPPTGGGELVPEEQSPQHHTPVPVQQAAAPAHAAAGSGAARGPYADEIQAATDLHLAGLANEATAKAAQAKANEVATQAYMQQAQQITDRYTKQFDDMQARAESVRQSILNNPVDANKLWNDSSTAGQMATLVGMALGGLAGAQSGRGGNPVMDLVNRTIDRDLAAQEANLGAKQGVLASYLQSGMQINQARQLAKADALTTFSAQLEANAYKTAPGQIQAQALEQAGNVLAQAQQLRLNVAETGAKVELARSEAQRNYLANTMTGMELNWLRSQGGVGQGGAPGANPAMVNNFLAAKVMGPEFLGSQIPGVGYVPNDALRKQITDVMPSLIQAHHSLDVLDANKESLGQLLAGTVGMSEGQANINTQLENLRAQIPLIAQAAPGRMRSKLTAGMVPHARELLLPSGQQKLRDLRETLLGVQKSWQISNGGGQ